MRIAARHWGAGLGVALLLLTVHDVRPSQGAEGTTWLGVYSQSLTPELREGLEYQGQGVLVTRVVDGSPAQKAGIRKGDVIVRVDNDPVDSPAALARVVRASPAGESVVVQVVRDGQRLRLSTRLASRSSDDGEDESEDERGDAPTPHDPDRSELKRPNPPDLDDDDVRIEVPEGGFSFRGMGRGRLGVRVDNLNEDLGDYFGVKDGKGVLVVEVLKGTPAERAGIKPGDVVTRVDGRAVSDSDDLVRALSSKQGKVDLTVVRRGSSRVVEAELEEGQPRIMRLRRGDGPMSLREDGAGRRRATLNDPERQELQRELKELRQELQDLRKELDELRRR